MSSDQKKKEEVEIEYQVEKNVLWRQSKREITKER